MPDQLIERANRVLGKYLKKRSDISGITDIVYAVGKAIASTLGIRAKERHSNKVKNGNKRERKIKQQMKELRVRIARISNEIHHRKEHRKATRKEKEILKEIQARISGKKATTSALMIHREQLLDTMRYMKVKLEKMVFKAERVRNNVLFGEDE